MECMAPIVDEDNCFCSPFDADMLTEVYSDTPSPAKET